MRFFFITTLSVLLTTSMAAPTSITESRAVNFEPVANAAVPDLGEIFEGHKTSAEHAAMGIGYSKRTVNFKAVEGANVPDLGEIFEGHKTSAEHAAMGIGY
ncbi:uncharacterized protein LY89DRAFT_683084 [Mollisia scopiformis]|uniref:Uncharacterized protein n=1 Tax=Mollisia scopiformis TaxID=149040 RepID=A0A194XG52_MOLSC|nr:uncharacterized protein LY89DRAFT_683084 [Mollisia scopiformis]KUJ19153.1 hypothetical protein LY89DRAFT_683084 [Mollisia scopiformis]